MENLAARLLRITMVTTILLGLMAGFVLGLRYFGFGETAAAIMVAGTFLVMKER